MTLTISTSVMTVIVSVAVVSSIILLDFRHSFLITQLPTSEGHLLTSPLLFPVATVLLPNSSLHLPQLTLDIPDSSPHCLLHSPFRHSDPACIILV